MGLHGYWADLKSSDFVDLPSSIIAVLPIGAIEQHGPHLPLSVDRDLIDTVLQRSLPLLTPDQNVLILPTISVSKSAEHDHFAGTLSLSATTVLSMLGDLAASLARIGVERIVLFNGHGGNTALLEVAAREMRIEYGMIVATASWFGFADMSGFDTDMIAFDLHGGDIETSAMMAARPDLVDFAKAQDFHPGHADWEAKFKFIGLTGQAAKPAWVAQDIHPSGVCGNAANASATKGEKLLNSAAGNFASFLEEFSRFDHRAKN